MDPVIPGDADRHRRRVTAEIKKRLRELGIQLTLLDRQVSTHLGLKDIDLDCLDLINAQGPLSPTALAQRAGLHPATTTGVLDRLERAGWVSRDRDPADRRATLVRAVRERNAELLALFAGMNASMERICAEYEHADLERFAEFLHRTTDAGRSATEVLADG